VPPLDGSSAENGWLRILKMLPAHRAWLVSRNNSSRNVFETTGKENWLRTGL